MINCYMRKGGNVFEKVFQKHKLLYNFTNNNNRVNDDVIKAA